MEERVDLESINLYDPDLQEDWFPAYRTLLEQAPVYQIPGTTVFVICKYEDILTVVRDLRGRFRERQVIVRATNERNAP